MPVQAQGRCIDALADCGRARALDPAFRRPLHRMAAALARLRMPQAAAARLRQLRGLGGASAAAAQSEQRWHARLESLVRYGVTPDHFGVLGISAEATVRIQTFWASGSSGSSAIRMAACCPLPVQRNVLTTLSRAYSGTTHRLRVL
jgi:hypothetical protein